MRACARPADALAFLHDCVELRDLDAAKAAEVLDALQWFELDGREPLLEQGAPADAVYLVHSGVLRAIEATDDGTRVLREHRRGDLVGEAGVLAGTPRSASIIATRSSIVARLDAATFLGFLERFGTFAVGMARTLSQRLVNQRSPRASHRLVAMVPLGGLDGTAEWRRFVDQLVRAADATVHRWVDLDPRAGVAALEQAPGVQVIVAERLDASALHLCRQVDEIVLGVRGTYARGRGDASEVASLAELDSIVRGVLGPTSRLAIFHDGATRPSGTDRLLAGFSVSSHHHVRTGNAHDVRVVARTVVGRSLSLVLGGGGARGAAHIGVMRAMHEAGVEIDHFGGTSMGAIVGSAAAADLPLRDLPGLIDRWRSSGALRDVTIPTVSLLHARKTEAFLVDILGTCGIEDLWRNFLCTSVDLTDGRLAVHESGAAAQWVRASGCVPGVFPPVVAADGHLHIDGGMLNNVPADLMRARWNGRVLSIDVGAAAPTMTFPHGRGAASGVRYLIDKRRKRPTLPSVAETLQRGATLSSSQQNLDARRASDVFLVPDLAEFGLFDFARTAEIVERGYRTASEHLDEIVALAKA